MSQLPTLLSALSARRTGASGAWPQVAHHPPTMNETTASDRTDREDVLALLAETIEMTHERIELDAAASPDEQELQIKWIRALGYLSGQYRKLLNDEDLDEMAAELDLLKAADGGDP